MAVTSEHTSTLGPNAHDDGNHRTGIFTVTLVCERGPILFLRFSLSGENESEDEDTVRKPVWLLPSGLRHRREFSRLILGCLSSLLMAAAPAVASPKDAPEAAIVLFDTPQGAAYVQLTGITLNGKTDLRVCEGVPRFNKSAYNAFPHVSFKQATSLQRGADGVLTLNVTDKTVCVVPANLNFGSKTELTPAEAADQAVVQGTPVSDSQGVLRLMPTAQVVFIPAPDVELADFLRAKRANTDRDWRDFIGRYPTSKYASDARNALAGLHQRAAQAAFARYQQSTRSGKQDLSQLHLARVEAQAAAQASAGNRPATDLLASIDKELDQLLGSDRASLQAFQKALQDRTPGYAQLASAQGHLEQLLEVRSDYPPLVELRREVEAEQRKVLTTLSQAESLAATGRHDDALNLLGVYVSFASELPRMDALVSSAYRYHFKRGQEAAASQEWEQASIEFRKALTIRPASREAESSLENVTSQLNMQHDQQAANFALLESKTFENKGQIIEAYNVLADLPEKQRPLVASRLAALTHDYLSAATRRAQKLQETHLPIKVRADEDAACEAYSLLSHASSLSGDPAVMVKRDFLSSKISSYYLDQGERYLQKPSGAGIGVGWFYLQAAQQYGITNLDRIRELMAQYAPLYQRKARLSIGLVLRDQTSRNEGAGFADQIADSIASGIDASGVSVEFVRKSSDADASMQPSFILIGEVLEHRSIKNSNLEAPLSTYRAGTHEAKNPAWIQAKKDSDAAQAELAAAQSAFSDAQFQHKKKEIIAAANDAVRAAQAHADQLQHALDMTEENRIETVIEPYHYTKKTVDLSASVDLAFRLTDRAGSSIGQPFEVSKKNRQSVVLLQDVKPEDVQGITNQGTEPSEVQFLTEQELEARNAVVKAVREKALELPAKVLQDARMRVQSGDPDGAAESYIVYLNSASQTSPPDRDEALKFLKDRFNLTANPPQVQASAKVGP